MINAHLRCIQNLVLIPTLLSETDLIKIAWMDEKPKTKDRRTLTEDKMTKYTLYLL